MPTIFIILNKLPLNPNGKVDKPNLPFPDIAEQTDVTSNEDLKRWESLTETERTVATKWADLIPGLNAKTVTSQNDFFDLGGHSILAQQMLLDICRETGANVSINTLYEHPNLAGFSTQIDRQLGPTSGVNGDGAGAKEKDLAYSQTLDELLKQLPPHIKQRIQQRSVHQPSRRSSSLVQLDSWALILSINILERTSRAVRLIAHVRSVKDPKAALDRLRRSLQGYGL